MAKGGSKILSNFLYWINWIPGFLILLSALALVVKPSWSALVAISGLGFPFLLVWEFLMIIMLGILLSKRIWQPILFVALSWFSFVHLYSFGNTEIPLNRDELIRVASWNVRFFDPSFHNPEKKSDLDLESYSYIRSVQADLMGFQEFRKREKIKLEKAFKYIAYDESFAFGSNYPIARHGHYKFEKDISYGGNGFQWVDVHIGKNRFRIYNCHLSSIRLGKSELDLVEHPEDIKDQEELKGRSKKLYQLLKQGFIFRQAQQEVMLAHMKESPYPVILLGDMNDTPNAFSAKKFREHFKDSWYESGHGVGKSYVHRVLPFRIDYIYLPEEMPSYQSKVYKSKLSDHSAISTLIDVSAFSNSSQVE